MTVMAVTVSDCQMQPATVNYDKTKVIHHGTSLPHSHVCVLCAAPRMPHVLVWWLFGEKKVGEGCW